MFTVKKLKLIDLPQMADISVKAYPGFQYPAKVQYVNRIKEIQQNSPNINFYGCFTAEELLGVMRIHDFQMNFRNKFFPVTGIGGIAVDLLHKKEKVCKKLIEYFIDYANKKDAPLTILFPFRPDFYYNMGYGYGAPLFQYNLLPSAFPRGNSKEHLQYIDINNVDLIVNFYNEAAQKQHGLCLKDSSDFEGFLKKQGNFIIGYKNGNKLEGYLIARFVKAHKTNFVINDLEILEFLYSDKNAFLEFSTFLNSQSDQVKRIVYNTFDPEFFHLVNDVRTGSDYLFPSVFHESYSAGIGIMYKITDLKKFLSSTENFGKVNVKVKFVVSDSFSQKNDRVITAHFRNGKPAIIKTADYDVELRMNIAEFSSMIMGAVTFKQCYKHGLAEISDIKYLERIHKLFYLETKPQCLNWF
jgi:predicted acetyltransferase